ncbi:MAG: GMC family oxidoreductase [Rhodospirillales bacterium]
MIFDFNQTNPSSVFDREFDVVVVGAGAAGITLALALSEKGRSVALVEAGGLEYSEESQEQYKGSVVGDSYFDLDVARLRFLGGSTNHWGGWCRTFEPVDFERGYLGEAYKWPLSFTEVDCYKAQACEILEISSEFEAAYPTISEIKQIIFQFSPPVLFGQKYQNALERRDSVALILNANMTDVGGENRTVEAVGIESYSGHHARVRGKKVVLAMGGIENSRYLLWINAHKAGHFFDPSLPLGAYWMEHPHSILGDAIIDRSKVPHPFYALTGHAQKQLRILGCGLRIHPLDSIATKTLIEELLYIAPALGKRLARQAEQDLAFGAHFRAAWEQSPSIESTVTLSRERDRFGVPRVALHWRKAPFDRETLVKSIEVFNDWLLKKDAGRIRLSDWLLNNGDYPASDELAGYHHMGGTRMHRSPRYGVVDRNSKIFGSKNLYVAGSSVFTTGGHNNPTLPIIQLTLRLADHLLRD